MVLSSDIGDAERIATDASGASTLIGYLPVFAGLM
jgi:hypothetical protein